jgi:hypothetical protein
MMLGLDPALNRQVWIHWLPPGGPPVGAARARLARAGRLRWVNGRRALHEAWDAYEAPDGAPLLRVCATPQPWRVVQHWLIDLARELCAASADGSMPVLALDRVWITKGSQARLLDFPAPGSGTPAAAGDAGTFADPQRFLARVMAHALGAVKGTPASPGGGGPLPRLARSTLEALDRSAFASIEAVAQRAAALAEGPDRVTRARRAVSILLANVPLLFAVIALSVGLPTAVRLLQADFLTMTKALVAIRSLDGKTDAASVKTRAALELFAADRFHDQMADDRTWRDPRSSGLLTPLRPIAQRILSSPSIPTDDERRAAVAAAEAELGNTVSIRTQALGIAAIVPALVLLLSAIAAVLSALLFPGGLLLRWLGLAVVARGGSDVTRFRAAWRAIVAWSPILLLWLYVWARAPGGREPFEALSSLWAPAAAAAAAIAGAAWAIVHPARGLPDRLTGTWLVPR